MKSNALSFGFVLVGILCLIVAALYALGVLQIFTSVTSGPHYKHMALFGALAVASFIAANFLREKVV